MFAEGITESCVSAATVIPTPEAAPSVLTRISCFVWDSPPRSTRSAGLIIVVFFCCSLSGCRAFVMPVPQRAHHFKYLPREPEKTKQQLLIGWRNSSGIFPVSSFLPH